MLREDYEVTERRAIFQKRRRFPVLRFVFLTLIFLILPNGLSALEFTGNTDNDFPSEACFADPGGQNIALLGTFPPGSASGFDVDQICLLWDQLNDNLYVGIRTFDHGVTGLPIPFGDADGNGNPGTTGSALSNEGGTDWPNLSNEEHFAFILDFDRDLSTLPDVVAGISASRSAPNGYLVSQVASPHLGLNFSFLDAYYGSAISASSASKLYASPSATEPHLEFTIESFSDLPGINNLDLDDPDVSLTTVFKAGSLGDTVIGDEDVRLTLALVSFSDSDGDDSPNATDWDQDNDGIPNITEQDMDLLDLDGNGRLNAVEIIASGLDSDGDGDIDLNDNGITYPDTDQDRLSDFIDVDADDDTILDIDEAKTIDFDDDDDLSISPTELLNIDLEGNYEGGDDSGALHHEELPDTDQDNKEDYRDTDSDNDTVSDAVEAGDDDPSTPPVDTDHDGTPDYQDLDSDDDGLADREEAQIGTDRVNPDSDGDGVSDGDEFIGNADPLTPGDGVDPDVDVPRSAEVIQVQGSGLGGCSLVRPDKEIRISNFEFLMVYLLTLFSPFLLTLLIHFRRLAPFFFILIGLLIPFEAYPLNTEQLRPHFDGYGLINLLDTKTLERRSWSSGFHLGYFNQPVELGVVGTGRRLDNLVDYVVNITLTGAYGVNDWATVGIVIPFFPAMDVEPLGSNNSQSTASFGDMGIAGKLGLWQFDDNVVKMGFAVSPFLTFPSGDLSKFVGDDNVTGGFKIIYDAEWKTNKFVINSGLRFREKENLLNLSIGQEWLFGLGYTRPIWEPADLHALTEISGSTALNSLLTHANRSPLEWLFGIRKGLMEGAMQATLASSVGLTSGYGSPDFRVLSSLTYTGPPIAKKDRGKETRTMEEKDLNDELVQVTGKKIVTLEPIHFETGSWEIRPDSFSTIQALADLLIQSPDIHHVVVKGHTDAKGDDTSNLTLSEKRARTIVNHLIGYGVESGRLTFEGWGELQPITDNRTEEGMAKNRRVEFHIVEVQSGDHVEEDLSPRQGSQKVPQRRFPSKYRR